MKQYFKITVKYKVKAESREQAEEFVGRLQHYGFGWLSEHERPTWKAIKHWRFIK
jgi:hypothetical protein